MSRRIKSGRLIASLLICPLAMAAQESRHHDAHVHGESTLEMVLEANAVHAVLRGPAANFYGFEYAPSTDEERAAVRTARQALEAPDRLLVLDAAAGCDIEETSISLPHHEDGDHHDHHDDGAGHEGHDGAEHDHGEDDAHAEVTAVWTWQCAESLTPGQVSFHLHDAFPYTETVNLTLLTSDGETVVRELRDSGARLAR